MKSKLVGNKESKPVALTYPVLMEDNRGKDTLRGLVVLFTDRNTGVVVHGAGHINTIGKSSSGWVEADDASEWKRYEGKVELSN